MNTQITLNKNNEVEMLILPTKDNKIFKKYRCYAYSSKIDLVFMGIYHDDTFMPTGELQEIYTTTKDLKKAIKQDLLKVYNTTDDLKGAYLKAGGALDRWEHDITNSYESFKEQAQTRALRTISGIAGSYEKFRNAYALNASEDTLIDAYAFTLLTNEEQHKAIEKTLKADDYKQEEARRLSNYLLDTFMAEYGNCDYIKRLLSIQDIMQCAFKAGYKTLKAELTNGTYQKIDVEINKDLGRVWSVCYKPSIDSIFYYVDVKLSKVKQIIYRNMILWEAK